MPMHRMTFRPGINVQATPTLNSGGWSFSNLIRFRLGLLEKIGGWLRLGGGTQFSPAATIIGTARGLHAFQDLNGIDYLAIGSEQRLQLYTPNVTGLTDITPFRKTSNLSTPITTNITVGSSTELFKITDTAHGAVVGDWILIPLNVYANDRNTGDFQLLGPQDGLDTSGFYQVQNVIDANNYTIGTFASTVTNVTGVTSLFTTTNTMNTAQVTLGAHGFSAGDVYYVYISTIVGGITFSGAYVVQTVIDNSNFTITAGTAATSSTTGSENSGDVRIEYLLPTGNVSDTILTGYGTGPYGIGPYGMSMGSTYISPLRNWFLDNFGQDLVALPTGGTLYQWVPPIATGNVATAVTNAPANGNGMFVAMPQAMVVILGATVSGGAQDPLLVAWCDNGNITVWTAAVNNQAGTYRLSRGSRIVGGLQGPQFGLIWTDLDLWVMNYLAYPLVWGFNIVGEQCGLISPKGANILNGTAYWMSLKGFFEYNSSSGVVPIQCPIWDQVFTRLDTVDVDKIFTAPNSLFNEMAWFFPSTDTTNPTAGEIDSYAKYNVAEGEFDYGSLVRFAWIDTNVFGAPIATGGNPKSLGYNDTNLILQHEIGYNADDVAMADVYAQSGYVDISDGTQFIFVDWIIPDFVWKTTLPSTQPRVTITIYTQYYPGDLTPSIVGPFTVTPATPYFSFRTRARQMAIRIECDTIDTFWRVGAIRYRGAPAGKV